MEKPINMNSLLHVSITKMQFHPPKLLGWSTDPILGGFCRRGKLEVAGNEGREQAGKADRTDVPLQQNPLMIGSVGWGYDYDVGNGPPSSSSFRFSFTKIKS